MSDERYERKGKIGQGGVGAVYRAFERGGGDVRVSHFCDDYFEARLKYHILQAKADKLRDMIHLGQQV